MDETLAQLNLEIHKEADEILYGQGLFILLQKYGHPHISGSYELDLMTWRDLDIYLETENLTESNFFALGGSITTLLHAKKMHYRNESEGTNKQLPQGLYWGIYLGNERDGAWKIDVWAVDAVERQRLLKHCNDLKVKLTESTRDKIIEIKSRCWNNPQYRRSFTSADIYNAVFNYGISTFEEFEDYLKTHVFK